MGIASIRSYRVCQARGVSDSQGLVGGSVDSFVRVGGQASVYKASLIFIGGLVWDFCRDGLFSLLLVLYGSDGYTDGSEGKNGKSDKRRMSSGKNGKDKGKGKKEEEKKQRR